jgi:hypothetical protein
MTFTGKTKYSTSYTNKTAYSTSFSGRSKVDVMSNLWNILNSPWLEAYEPWLDDTTAISTDYTFKTKL